MRRLVLSVALSAALAACTHDVVIDGPVNVAEFKALPNNDLDILFVIDNSPSMADKQASLAANFPRMMDRLATLDGGLPNLHIGVVSSDMGTSAADGTVGPAVGPGQQGGCAGSGDDGHLLGGPSGGFISDIANFSGGRDRNYTGELRDAFATAALVGDNGCGFEQHLRAMERGLTNPLNAGFIRATANLAVVIVADEDDCSMLSPALLGDDVSLLGVLESYRCTRFGVTCEPDDPTHPHGDLHACAPRADSPYVEDVQPLVDFLQSFKPDPRMVMVAAVVGDPAQVATELRAPSSGGEPVMALAHACTFAEPDGTMAVADPAVRIGAFVDAFRGRASLTSICNADLSDPLSTIGESARGLMGQPCLGGPLADTSPAPGLQPSCAVVDLRDSAPDHQVEVPACTAATTGDCYELVEDATACPSSPDHLHLALHRTSTVAADQWTRVDCQLRR